MEGLQTTAWSIDRGRSSELEKTGTGTAKVTFADLNGTLDPTNLSSPFFGQLDPMKQATIALQNPVTEEWSTLFRGYVSEFPPAYEVSGINNVTVELVDAFDIFSSLELTPVQHGDIPVHPDFADVYFAGTPSNLPGEPDVFMHVDDRIHALLDAADWPVELRNIFSGNVSVQGKVYERRDQLLSALMDAADAEFPGIANIFVSKDGIVTFHGRFARFFPGRPGYGINTWQLGGKAQADADENVVPISDFDLRRSEADIINYCQAYPLNIDDTDAPGQLTKDDISISTHGWRGVAFDSLLTSAGHDDDGNPTTALEETKKFADYYVANFKDPKTRVTRIVVRPRSPESFSGPATWAFMCGVEIGDVISLDTTHRGGGGFDEDFYVEGVHYEARPMRASVHEVTVTLDVSPSSYFASNPFGDFDLGES